MSGGMSAVDDLLRERGFAASRVSEIHALLQGSPIHYARIEPPHSGSEFAEELRSRFSETGVWPLLLEGEVTRTDEICGSLDPVIGGTDAIQQSLSLDGLSWLPSYINADNADVMNEHPDVDILAAIAEGPADEAGLIVGGDWTGPLILLVPCEQAWEAVCRAGFGGWNDCPSPPFQAAFHRSLGQLCGFEPQGLGSDKLLAYISRPPTASLEIVALVRALRRYCGDLSIATDEPGLARIIAAGPEHWGFWWD